MPHEEQYLVRGPDGRMVTIVAYSVDGAKRMYLGQKRPPKGSQFSVKPRGHGEWTHFDVI
jgi:hypothetical protein